LVPSCCVIFDLEPLSLSFDFVFSFEIFKSFLEDLENQSCESLCVGIKRLQDNLRVTASQLQLLSDYYCWKDYADRDEIKDLSKKR
ncbi:hypothetical protein Tco_1488873, partial [Tanacetum coccineum]